MKTQTEHPQQVDLGDPVPSGQEQLMRQVAPDEASAEPIASQFLYQLHFEQLRNLTTLAVSATGGGLLALQAGLLDFSAVVEDPAVAGLLAAFPLICFAFAAVLSLLTQRTLIKDLAVQGQPSKGFGWMSEVANALFGAGVGSATAILLLMTMP